MIPNPKTHQLNYKLSHMGELLSKSEPYLGYGLNNFKNMSTLGLRW